MRCSKLRAGAAMAALLLFPAVAGAASDNQKTVIRGATRSARVTPRIVDVDLRDLPVVKDWEPGDRIKEIPRRHWSRTVPPGNGPAGFRDPLVDAQDAVAGGATADSAFGTPGVNVAGQGFSGVNPPDPSGDIGASHYIQAINGSGGATFTVYSKTGALLAGPSQMDALGTGDCATGLGDPIVLYDHLADRWLISEFSNAGNRMCVYVSRTADPVSGGWYAYSFQAPAFPDYPKYGVWPDAYYVGANESSSSVYAFDRAKMLLGQPATFQRFTAAKLAGFGFQLLTPADLDGATQPPAGAPAVFMRHRDDEAHNSGSNNTSQDYLEVWEFKVDWANSANSTFTGPSNVAVAEFDSTLCGLTSFSCVPQPGSTTKLDPLREPVMYKLQYRNFGTYQSLVGNLATDVGSDRAAVRWFELRKTGTTWTVAHQGTYAPDTSHRWMASAAQDKQGNLAIAYNVSAAATVYPGLRYAGRLATDAANTLPQPEALIVAGSAANSSNRWGDYAQLGVDPVDDCTFWFTGQYSPSANWATRIASFKFDQCGGGTPSPDYSVSASPSSLGMNPGGSGSSTVTVASANGFSSAVSLSASGLPAGVTASFAPASVTPAANGSASSTLTLTASSSAAAGTYPVTVTATSGSTTRTTSVSLTVNALGGAAYDGTLGAPRCSVVGNVCDSGTLLNGRGTLGPEPSQPNTVDTCTDGTSGSYHSDESNDKIRVVSVDGTDFAAGKQVRVEATVWAYSSFSSDKLDLYYSASATSPSWTLIGTLSPTVAGAQTLSATYTLPTGSVQAVRARFRYQGSAAACGTGSYDDHDDLVFAVGAGASDTTAPTASITAPAAGATVSGAVTVSATASDNVGVTKVDFFHGTTLIGTDTTSPYSVTWTTTGVANGSYSLTAKASDAAGNVGTSAAVAVTVNNPTSSELIVNGGFDTTTTPWVVAANWTRNTSAYMQSANINSMSTSNTLYQQFTIPATATGTGTFSTYITTQETTTSTVYDRLYVEVRNTSGTLLTTLATYSNLNKSTGWVSRSVNLSAYKGQTVRLQFRATSDSSLPTVFRVDTVSVK